MLNDFRSQNAFVKETLRFSVGIIHPLPRVVGPATPAIGDLKLPVGVSVFLLVVPNFWSYFMASLDRSWNELNLPPHEPRGLSRSACL